MTKEVYDVLKEEGNRLFSQQKYQDAIASYSKAIDLLNASQPSPNLSTFYSNRALCYYRLERYYHCQEDCSNAIRLNPNADKVFYRRGMALHKLNRLKSAYADFQQASKLNPANVEAKKELENLKTLLASSDSIRMEPMEIDKQFVSSQPLQKIFISNADHSDSLNSQDGNALVEKLHLQLETKIPQSFSEFQRFWRDPMLSQNESKIAFLKSMTAGLFNEICNYPLEADIMFEIIHSLLHVAHSEALFVYRILASLVRTSRFDLNLMFLTKTEKDVVQQIFHKIKASNNVDSQKLIQLAKSYHVSLN